MTSFRSNSSN